MNPAHQSLPTLEKTIPYPLSRVPRLSELAMVEDLGFKTVIAMVELE
jgi:hypothetical protein